MRTLLTVGLVAIKWSLSGAPAVEQLGDIVGTWQSDTTNGTSVVTAGMHGRSQRVRGMW